MRHAMCFLTTFFVSCHCSSLPPSQISSREHSHLKDLSGLRFLVVDEADRMVKQGNFPELEKIFEVVNQPVEDEAEEIAESEEDESEEEEEDEDEDEGGEEDEDGGDDDDDEEEEEVQEEEDTYANDEGLSRKEIDDLIGFRGEHKVRMLDESILKRIAELTKGPTPSVGSSKKEAAQVEKNPAAKKWGKETKGLRQTFVFSATLTLTLGDDGKEREKKGKDAKKQKKASKELLAAQQAAAAKSGLAPGSILAEILRKAGSVGKVKVVDLTNDSASAPDNSKGASEAGGGRGAIALPPGLSLCQARCATLHKDSHLFAYLSTTAQGTSGPSIVFCNSIAGCKRVGETMEKLGLPVKVLHAQLQQVRNEKRLCCGTWSMVACVANKMILPVTKKLSVGVTPNFPKSIAFKILVVAVKCSASGTQDGGKCEQSPRLWTLVISRPRARHSYVFVRSLRLSADTCVRSFSLSLSLSLSLFSPHNRNKDSSLWSPSRLHPTALCLSRRMSRQEGSIFPRSLPWSTTTLPEMLKPSSTAPGELR